MRLMRRAWIGALALSMVASAARADEPLVPEGEGLDVLEHAVWFPLITPHMLATSPDGKVVATVSEDGALRLWDATTGRETRRFPVVSGGQTAVAFSADGKTIAAGGRDGSITLSEALTGKALAHRDGDGVPVTSLSISPDGKVVAAGATGHPPIIWRTAELGEPADVTEVSEARGTAFSPSGNPVAFTRADHTVSLVDPGTHKVVKSLTAPAGSLGAVGFSADGHLLAAGSDTGALYIWDLSTGAMRTIEAHSQAITSVRFAGDLLLTSSLDGSVRLWNGLTLALIRKLTGAEGCCTSVGVAPATTVVATTAHAVSRWDLTSGTPLPSLQGQPAAVGAVATAGTAAHSIAVASADGSGRVLEGVTGRVLRDLGTAVASDAIALGPDENTVAFADAQNVVHTVDVATGSELHVFPALESRVVALVFSPDGKQLAAATAETGARVWDVQSGHKQFDLDPHAALTSLTYAGGGAWLVTTTASSFGVWGVTSGNEIKRVAVDSAIAAIAPTADGRRVFVGLADGTIRQFETVGGETGRFVGHAPGRVFVGLAGGGKTLVSGGEDGSVRFWDVASHQQTARIDGHSGPVTSLAVSADGSLAIVGTVDGGVRLWGVADHASHGLFRNGPTGWLSVTNGNHVLRLDDGRLVQKKIDDLGTLAAVPPKATTESPELTAEITAIAPPGQGPHTGKITVRVANAANAARAYWVTIEAVQLPEGMVLLSPPVIPRIDPGSNATIVVPVAFLSKGEPSPQDLSGQLKVVHAFGSPPSTLPFKIHVTSARVDVRVVALEGNSVQLQLINSGDDAAGALTLVPTFVDKGATSVNGASIPISDLSVKGTADFAVAFPEGAPRNGQLQLAVHGALGPSYTWSATVSLRRSLPWGSIFGVLILLAAIGGGGYLLNVRRNPIVRQVMRDSNELRQYDLTKLPIVDKALVRARKLQEALTTAKITEARWQRVVNAGASAEGAAAALTEALGAKRQEQPISGHDAWHFELPPLQLRFPLHTAIAVITGARLETPAATVLGAAIQASGDAMSFAVAIDLTAEQNAPPILQSVPRMSWVVLTSNELRDILLADDPLWQFQRVMAIQRPLTELSPYQHSGGVEDSGLFFGRERELRLIADRVLHNFIIVAPRQMGKSSLLKAVHRRLQGRPDVEVHLITLFEEDLVTRVAHELNRPRPESTEAFLEIAAGTRRKPRVWLFDECDSFIVKDANNKYPIAQAMRTLSEEGRAFFILAGFWHLYAAAYLNPNNPLRNFGELLRLEPLDRESARELATKPMEALGLSYEDPTLVETLLDETACRAHLVVAICRGMIDRLGPEEHTLTSEVVGEALYQNPSLADEFKYWRREPLGRAILRLTMIEGPGTRGELHDRLTRRGLEVPNALFQAVLDRLDLGFLLTPNPEGRLECPVPLLKRFIEQEDELELALRRDLEDFIAVQSRAAGVAPPAPAA